MKILVTGSAGHLGEALMRTLRSSNDSVIGIDIKPSDFTDCVGSIGDRDFVSSQVKGCDAIIHTATLHKPHVGTHSRQDFIDTNVSGTLNLLEEAGQSGCSAFVYTSTTSTFGDAMQPAKGEPAVWVTEKLRPKPKNIYGVTKTCAEELCELFNRNTDMPCIVLKTSRFFPEADDAEVQRSSYDDANLKVNELLNRRVDVADIVTAHRLAISKAGEIGFGRFIISSTPPFAQSDASLLSQDVSAVLRRYVPEFEEQFERRNWTMFPTLDRVYDNSLAREQLGWEPRFTFQAAINSLKADQDHRSELARAVGAKGYHSEKYKDGPYPVGSF
ncbi:MAG: NAD-dependent epimerase/dehydratase family protein [Granulosicoccus sp.]